MYANFFKLFLGFSICRKQGKLKKLIRTPKSPLTQIVNRLAKLDAMPNKMIRQCHAIDNITFDTHITDQLTVKKIIINKVTITLCKPNNFVTLRDGNLFKIKKLYVTKHAVIQLNEVILEGYIISIKGNAFEYPHASSRFGIIELGNRIRSKKQCSGAEIESKFIFKSV